MAINIDYGPISAAMGLATQAGQNQGRQLGFQDDMSLLGYMTQAQRLAQSQRAQDIQTAMQGGQLDLEAQRNQATQQLSQQELAARTAYQQANLQSLNGYRQNQGAVAQQNAESRAQQVQNTGDYQQGRLDVSGQNSNTMQQYRGALAAAASQNANTRQQGVQNQNTNTQQRNSTAQDEADTKALLGEGQALTKYVQTKEANFTDPNDPDLKAAKQRLQQIQQTMMMRNTNLANPAVHSSQPVKGQPQAQAQPGSAPSNPVQVTNQAQYNSLPSGAYYTDSRGVLAQKP